MNLLWVRVLAVIVVFAGCTAVGWGVRDSKAKADIAELQAEFATERVAAAQKAHQFLLDEMRKRVHAEAQITLLDKAYTDERINASVEIEHLRGQLFAGTRRLSLPVSRVNCPASVPTTPDHPGQPVTEARADLDATTSEALVALTSEGDDAIRQLNALIDVVNVMQQHVKENDHE